MNIALFDFDGTLTTQDTLPKFIKFAVGWRVYFFKLILFSPIFLLFKLKLISNHVAKQKLISFFFKNWREEKFKQIANSFSSNKIDLILRDDIYNLFLKHIENNDKVIVVSASIECWLKPWCIKHDVDILSTKLEFKDGLVTGKFINKNCFGIEKVNRIDCFIDIKKFDKIFAYGDSSGDEQMLKIATHSHMVR